VLLHVLSGLFLADAALRAVMRNLGCVVRDAE
jgi:hypothetical protein